jgi:hypothetical protein
VVDVPGQIDGRQRGGDIRQNASQTDVISLSRDLSKVEGVLDRFLYWQKVQLAYHVTTKCFPATGSQTMSALTPLSISISFSSDSSSTGTVLELAETASG